jgi:hypothetical protein
MMRISLDAPALIAVRNWLAGSQPTQRGRSGSRKTSRLRFRAEQLERRAMLDAGMQAAIPDLADESDTGSSNVDNLTSDRTPTLSGSVQGGATEVRLRIDGKRVAVLPVINGKWTYTVPAEKALDAGAHTIAVRPVAAPGKIGALSKELAVSVGTTRPAASTLVLGALSDTGVRGDGQTTYATPTFRGVAKAGRLVNVSIDGVFAGQVQSDAKTGAWLFKSPRLANGTHDVTAVVENRVGLPSAATSLQVTVNGPRTVMLDATGGQAVELTAEHLLGRNSQGFIVTQVHSGTLQKWSAATNAWLTIPARAMTGTDPASLQKAAAIRKVSFNDVIRWTPASGDVGTSPVFALCPSDTAGGPTAPTPAAGTVPGKLVDAQIAALAGGIGQAITWEDPTDGCGCPSTRYSIEVTREDGKTLLYNVPRTVHGVPIVEGGIVQRVKWWGATKAGAGEALDYDFRSRTEAEAKLAYTVTSGASFTSLQTRARAQLTNSPTANQFTTSLPLGGSHANLAYLQVDAVADATEAEQGLPAGTPMIISSDSSRLTPGQLADLEANPIYASHLFPGTVNGEVQPDQVRAHFQAGETLRFAGTVDPSIRAGATIVVEKAQNLADGSLGPWFQEARISVGADGSFSHKYLVPYGLNSVRVRLEYPTQPAAASVGATSSPSAPISTPIDLSNSFNAFGITTPPWQVGNSQGFDGNGNYYNSDYNVDSDGTQNSPVPGTPIIYNGISFPIGPVPTNSNQVGGTEGPQNFVRATGQTITVNVDADKSDYLYLAGAASNGDQLSQVITLTFTDGTTETWTQSFHDWASDGPAQPSNPPWPPAYTTAPGANQKMPVKVATTAMLPNANYPYFPQTFSGLQTIDGVTLAEGDRVLVKNQNFEQYNGIYVASAGTWSRAKDALTTAELWNASMPVLSGTTNGGTYFWENTNPVTMDGDLTFVEIAAPVPAPRPFAGELNLKTEPERINQLGDLVTTPAHIFGYCRNLHGKQLASITLPNNPNIGILSVVVSKAPVITLDQGFESLVLGTTHLTGVDLMALTIANESNIGAGGGPLTFFFADQPEQGSTTSPPTYTTEEVTVPMGQQTTIAYVAPDSTSQMTFYVEKADGTCVGADCSTYLTDWTDGSGSSMYWAANITPSLNSQVKAGQHWTMTIQNAGLGYNGYLSSPSGQGLPSASGSTPAGAQFKLMTQNEITDQPPWAVALEEFAGEAIALVGLSILTAGAVDAAFAGAEVVDDAVDSVKVTSRVEKNTVTETVTADRSAIQAASAEAGQPPMSWGRRVARRAVMSEGWWQPEGADDMGHLAYRRLIAANWNPWDGT